MIKVKVITIGKCKEEWLKIALAEYEKRLSPYLEIQWVLLTDTIRLEKTILAEPHYISLSADGKMMDSFTFSQQLIHFFNRFGSRLSFVIGGPDGLSPNIMANSSDCWSLSRLTLTHQLTRLVLMEQIYRALEISKNSPYHKDKKTPLIL